MVTMEQVMAWKPCYSNEEIEKLFAGRESLSWEDVVALDIPTEDKLWALLHEEFIPARDLHLLACDFAEKVLCLADDPRCEDSIRAKRLWVDGKATDEDLAAARAAAWAAARAAAGAAAGAAARAAARAAAGAAAGAAARAAAWAAARAAARDAAWDAARAAARAAAGAAARAAARDAQLAMTVEVLRRLA